MDMPGDQSSQNHQSKKSREEAAKGDSAQPRADTYPPAPLRPTQADSAFVRSAAMMQLGHFLCSGCFASIIAQLPPRSDSLELTCRLACSSSLDVRCRYRHHREGTQNGHRFTCPKIAFLMQRLVLAIVRL